MMGIKAAVFICLGCMPVAVLCAQSKESPKKGPPADVKLSTCDGCIPVPGALHVTLRCRDNKAEANPSRVTDAAILGIRQVQWLAALKDAPHWTVVFGGKSPCQQKRFDRKNPLCQVQVTNGEYPYEFRLDGCSDRGEGVLVVQ